MKKIFIYLMVMIMATATAYAGTSIYTTSQMDTYLGYVAGSTAFGRSMWSLADAAALRALVDLEPGTDFYSKTAADLAFQPLNANLTTYAGITPSANVQTMLGSADNAAILSNIGAQAALTNPLVQTDINDTPTNGDTTHPASSNSVFDGLALKLNTSDVLDEDNFSTDSATKPPSQQSVKASFKGQIWIPLNNPADTDDFLLGQPISWTSMTITTIHGVCLSGDVSNYMVGGLEICTGSDGTSCSDVDSDITINGGLDTDDGTLSNPDLTTNQWLYWHTTSVTGSPGNCSITIGYTYVP
jgi:hypothetical protein